MRCDSIAFFLTLSICNVSPVFHFFISNLRQEGGGTKSLLFFTGHHQKLPSPLCLDSNPSRLSLSLLSFKVCRQLGYATYRRFRLTDSQLSIIPQHSGYHLVDSHVECTQQSLNRTKIDCRVNHHTTATSSCTNFLEVVCGPCSRKLGLFPGQTHTISSPLYPVLQPGLSCSWHFTFPEGYFGSLEIFDISLPPPTNGDCVNSSLQILSGYYEKNLESVASLCGELGGSLQVPLPGPHAKLLLTSPGNPSHTQLIRGINVSVTVPASPLVAPNSGLSIPTLVLSTLLSCLLCLFIVFLAHMATSRRKSKVRRGVGSTWQGARPSQGQSLHQARTQALARQQAINLPRQEGNSNIYRIDLSQPARQEEHREDIYETMSRLETPLNTPKNPGLGTLIEPQTEITEPPPLPPARPPSSDYLYLRTDINSPDESESDGGSGGNLAERLSSLPYKLSRRLTSLVSGESKGDMSSLVQNQQEDSDEVFVD